MEPKIGDFGFAVQMPEVKHGRSVIMTKTVACTQGYSAPEVADCRYSPKSDVYSYSMVCCHHIYAFHNDILLTTKFVRSGCFGDLHRRESF